VSFKFEMTHHNGVTVTLSGPGEAYTISEMVETFEEFLLGAGYRLPDGASLGYEYEDEREKFEETLFTRESSYGPCKHDPICHGKMLGTCESCAWAQEDKS
jgi:hypothetical protein